MRAVIVSVITIGTLIMSAGFQVIKDQPCFMNRADVSFLF